MDSPYLDPRKGLSNLTSTLCLTKKMVHTATILDKGPAGVHNLITSKVATDITKDHYLKGDDHITTLTGGTGLDPPRVCYTLAVPEPCGPEDNFSPEEANCTTLKLAETHKNESPDESHARHSYYTNSPIS